MSIEYAILGLLTAGPLHGYAIGKELNRLLGGIWPVNPGQVYATLDRLARDGAIASAQPALRTHRARTASAVATGDDTHAASVRPFALLPAGRRALRRWLDRPVGCALPRDPLAAHLALQAWAGAAVGIARLLTEQRARCVSLQALLERAAARDDAEALLVRAARNHLDAELVWLALVEQVLLAEPAAPETPPLLD